MSSIFWASVAGSVLVLTACAGGSGESEPDGTGGSAAGPNDGGGSTTSGSSVPLACGATADGDSETRLCFEAANVPSGQRCQSTMQTRTCEDGTWRPDFPSCAHLSCVVDDPVVTPGTIFHSDFESGALDEIFFDVNTYGGVDVALSTDIAHSGTSAVKITYPNDEAGVELKPAPFPLTSSLYARKYEYFAPGWEGNWPVGLKTSRFFTRDDFATGAEPDGYAYASEKLIWQTYEGDPNDQYARGLNVAIFNLDLEATYAAGTSFGNGQPYVRTGHWYKMETWMVLNSGVDVADGVLRIWIDDQVVYDRADVVWKSTSRGVPNGEGWQSMWFGGNYSGATFGGPSVPVDRYIDDVYLSTTLDQ
jgi:hypothetical protein